MPESADRGAAIARATRSNSYTEVRHGVARKVGYPAGYHQRRIGHDMAVATAMRQFVEGDVEFLPDGYPNPLVEACRTAVMAMPALEAAAAMVTLATAWHKTWPQYADLDFATWDLGMIPADVNHARKHYTVIGAGEFILIHPDREYDGMFSVWNIGRSGYLALYAHHFERLAVA